MQCATCGSTQLEEAGQQWFPLTVFEAHLVSPPITDPARPSEGALPLYTCTNCHTTFVEPFEALSEG